jgi:hypothetical protein
MGYERLYLIALNVKRHSGVIKNFQMEQVYVFLAIIAIIYIRKKFNDV